MKGTYTALTSNQTEVSLQGPRHLLGACDLCLNLKAKMICMTKYYSGGILGEQAL